MPAHHNVLAALRRVYDRMFGRREDVKTREVIQTLRQMPIFQQLSRRALRDLAAAMHRRDYTRDEVIYYEHDPGLGLYVVQRGRVRLLVEDEAGTPHELRQVGAHDLFGDLSIFGESRRMETAQALTDTQLLGFFRPDLRTMVKRNPRSGAAVLMALAHHLATRQAEMVQRLIEGESKVAAMRTSERTSLHGEQR